MEDHGKWPTMGKWTTMNHSGHQWTMDNNKCRLPIGVHCAFWDTSNKKNSPQRSQSSQRMLRTRRFSETSTSSVISVISVVKKLIPVRLYASALKFLSPLLILFILLLLPASINAEVNYSVEFIGIQEDCTRETLQSVSDLFTLKDHPPATPSALKARIDDDLTNLLKPLHSLGYYDAAIESHISQEGEETHVELHFFLGPLYRFAVVRAVQAPEKELCPEVAATFQQLDFKEDYLAEGSPALTQSVLDGRDSLTYAAGLLGYPLPKIMAEEVVVDRKTKTVSVTYVLDLGPQARMGVVSIDGLRDVKTSVVRHVICWKEGELYSPVPLEETEESLRSLNLFDYAKVHIDDQLAEDGTIPIFIEVMESKHHSVGLGISYTTQLGAGVSGEWVDRNVHGRGERLELQGVLMQLQQEAVLAYTIPNVWRSWQDLILKAEYEHENPISYNERSVELSAILRSRISCSTTISYGLAFRRLHSTHSRNGGRYALLKAPFTYFWRNTDYPEDPSEGLTFSLQITPNQDLERDYIFFLNSQATTTFYIPLDSKKREVFAGKFLVGSIVGARTPDIPAPERFYAGTEQTLRGYRYLTVSPLDAHRKPKGGSSIAVASFELRHKITQQYGVVLFYEIGNVYTPSFPELDHKQLQSAGLGFRYFTPIGPLRLDVAFPLNRRHGVDHLAEFYFSIGQTF